ncbi:MAG TPA: HEAT repeat domain-containing protein [Myxococcota bacterium]|nr:HEAT repeat domain-containing protein [Myxococcota bacterium]
MLSLLIGLALAQDPDLKPQVMDLLGQMDSPATAEDYQALGEGVDAVLIEVANDDSQPKTKRGRAIQALGYFPSDQSQETLTALLASSDSTLKRKAVFALCIGWGDAALPLVEPALADEDVQVRISTAKALAMIEGDAADTMLTARLEVETEDAVKNAIQKSLGN